MRISGCVTNECAPRSAFHLRGRRARHADHAESAATGRETGRNDRGDEPEHQQDFAGFGISYDNYHSTHSDENRELSTLIYSRLKENGFIKNRTISQLYDPEKGMFLPDRFVKGTCPKCKSPDQYGDNCEVCGATYSPTELIDPKSVVSGATPVMRDSEHFFFDLPAFSEMLQAWTRSGALQEQVANKMQEWFESGLQQWDISRDAPYFGFEIPDAPGKYFYVWLDAPIGYMGSFKNLCDKRGDLDFDEFWRKDSTTELYHFIGKDIVYFHSLFWPAMLEGSNFRKPTNLFVHGYVTVNGAKMSKSRGTFIKAGTYLQHLDADCLRYYYAAKLSSRIDDIDLNLEDFVQRVNADIVNKVVNPRRATPALSTNASAASWPTAPRRSGTVPDLRRRGAEHRRSLRRPRVQPRDPRNHGTGRSGQPLRG